ncbi:MAG: hypothetical protein ABFD49_11635 [Armatimonadota bacterium]|nr:YfhO family protein [bacterium]
MVKDINKTPYLLFLILVCLFLWKPIFTGAALLPGDYLAQMSPWNSVVKPSNLPPQWNPLQWDAIAQFYPWRVFYARSIHSGHIPLWNPHQFCGTPFLANGQSAVLYPGNLLFLIFDPITAFTIFAALHLFLAQAFTYKFMRELGVGMLGGIVSAICFAFSAFMVLWLELPTFISVAVYLPLTFVLIHRSVERKSAYYGMLAGGSLGLAFLAGHFQIAFYVGLAATLWWAWKLAVVWRADGQLYATVRVVYPFLLFVAIAVLISAPQVLLTKELAASSHRVREVTGQGYATFIGNAVKPYRMITAFVPDFFGNPSKNTYFLGSAADYIEYGLYIGILPLMLALVCLGRIHAQASVGFFAILGLVALLCAFGTSLNAPFYYLIPGFSALGGPNRILLLYFFGVAVMAGFGVDYFAEHACENIRLKRWDLTRGEIAGLLILLALGVMFAITNMLASNYIESIIGKPFSGLVGPNGRVVAVLMLISVSLLLARSRDTISREMFPVMVVMLIVADLFAFGINYNPTCARSKVYPDTPLTKKLQSLTKSGYRIAPINSHWSLIKTPEVILPPNAATVYGLYDFQGYDSLFTKSYKDWSSDIQGEDSSPMENGNMVIARRFTPDLGRAVEYILSRDEIKYASLELVDTLDGVHIYKSLAAGQARPPKAKPDYYTFRFGLYLMLVGVAAICGVGTYRFLKYNHH